MANKSLTNVNSEKLCHTQITFPVMKRGFSHLQAHKCAYLFHLLLHSIVAD